VAATNAQVYFIPREELLIMLGSSPTMSLELLREKLRGVDTTAEQAE